MKLWPATYSANRLTNIGFDRKLFQVRLKYQTQRITNCSKDGRHRTSLIHSRPKRQTQEVHQRHRSVATSPITCAQAESESEPQPKEPKPLDRPNPDHSRDDKQSQDAAADVAGRKDTGLAGADKLVSDTPGDKTTQDKTPSVGEALAGRNY
jgi:hypothetical protein